MLTAHALLLVAVSIGVSRAQTAVTVAQNLTVSFGPDSANTCPSPSTSPTFTTDLVPGGLSTVCYNLDELFAPNNTRNATGFYPSNSSTSLINSNAWRGEGAYFLSNPSAFDAAANYSRIFYHQINSTSSTNSDDIGEGKKAAISFITYAGRDCRNAERPPGQEEVDGLLSPWYGWTCQTGEEGSCDTLPYGVASFSVGRASRWEGKCWDFALGGGASSERVKGWLLALMVGGVVGLVV